MEQLKRQAIQGLMVRLADGDRSAFDPMFDALWPSVRRFAERALGSAADAEDAAQAALLKVFERAGDFDTDRDAMSWIFGVVAYECRQARQRRARRREAREPAELESVSDHDIERAAIARDLEAALHDAIGTLSAEDRQTMAAVIDGRRPDVPEATFRKRVERAMKRLRVAWSTRHGSD
jgi:RNA polymerase sigma factor (sigma-70 family)